MREKLNKAIKKYRSRIIIVAVLWFILSMVLVGPIAATIDAHSQGENIIKAFLENITKPFSALGASFSNNIGLYFQTLLGFTLVYMVAISYGIMRLMPKSEYEDIEHGSSDWCVVGEQYRILDPKEGIILAEKNYLPVNKRGNVNVLVIRRFWSW